VSPAPLPAAAPANTSSTSLFPGDPERAWYLQNGFQVWESGRYATMMTGLKPFVKDWLVELRQAAGIKVGRA
jgi:hypothetical protein